MFGVDTRGDSRDSAKESGLSGVDWDIGSVGIVAGSLEFFLIFRLRPPPLEVPQERRDSFLDQEGNGPSS